MITTRFYLDCRFVARGQAAPLRLVITKDSARAYVPLSVSLLPSHWDSLRQIVVGHPRKVALNNLIQSKKLEVDGILFRMRQAGELRGLRAPQIKDRVMAELFPAEEPSAATLYSCFLSFMEKKTGRTWELYKSTLSRLMAFCPTFASLRFEDVCVNWLEKFDEFLAKTAPSRNARNIHLRNVRAVFNFAIEEELTSCYPFRKFKIKSEPTRKRALSVEQLRRLFNMALDDTERRYVDFFLLSFMLCGINVVDLCRAAPAVDGRLEYLRAKTHRPYSIKIEPEAQVLVERYAGSSGLVNFAEGCKDYRSFYKHLADCLRSLSGRLQVSGFSSYWARHTWATIARRIGVSKDDIKLALGHGPITVTDIYIDEDLARIDEANRRVLDWVLYNKK